MQTVYATGLGAVSAHGVGVQALWDAAVAGKSGARHLTIPRLERALIKTAAHFFEFDVEEHLSKPTQHSLDRFVQFALVAAKEAIEHAKISPDELAGEQTAVIVGSGIGGASTTDLEYFKFYKSQDRGDSMSVPKVMPSAAASHISMEYRCNGPSFAVSSACSSSTQAIGLALQMLRNGLIDKAIVGGAEAILTAGTFRAWEALRVLSPSLCRPFSIKRDGMLLGEGAAMIVLESAKSLQQRGGRPLFEIAGYATNSDARDIVRPDCDSITRCMAAACRDANLEPQELKYINAHGTGTVINDRVESEALKDLLGEHLSHLPVSSTKPVHGHVLGAAGALELIVTGCATMNSYIPPTINWLGASQDCISGVVPNVGMVADVRYAMSNSFAFGGINSCLIVRKV